MGLPAWFLRGSVAVGLVGVVVVVMSSRPAEPPLAQHPRGPRTATKRRAVVLGATGATGRKVVAQLLASEDWSVTTLVRAASPAGSPKSERLTEVVVGNFAEMTDASVFENHDVLFNCIGTTRAGGHSPSGRRDDGGAKLFVEIEVGMTATVSRLAVEAGVKAVALVTAEGANAERFKGASWIEYIHPLLYMRTMGEKEQAAIDAGFERVSIFRPGLLHRQTGGGGFESVQDAFDLGLKVETLAAAMVRDAEAAGIKTGKEEERGEGGGEAAATEPLIYQGNLVISHAARL
jgi:hypothetical protein